MYTIQATHAKTGVVTETQHADHSAMFTVRNKLQRSGDYSLIVVLNEHGEWDRIAMSAEHRRSFKALTKRIADEKSVVRLIIRSALKAGYLVSLFDGEEWTVKYSNLHTPVMDAIYTTDCDRLAFHTADKSKRVGTVFLVYGNSASEVVADWSDNEITNSILVEAIAKCDALSAKGL